MNYPKGIGRLLAAYSIVLFALVSHAQPAVIRVEGMQETSQHEKDQKKAEHADQHTEVFPNSRLEPITKLEQGVNASAGERSNEQRTAEKNEFERLNAEAQVSISLATWWMVALQGLTVLLIAVTVTLTWRTLNAARTQTNILQKSQILEHRPWFELADVDAEIEPTGSARKEVRVIFNVHLRNIGKSLVEYPSFPEEEIVTSTGAFATSSGFIEREGRVSLRPAFFMQTHGRSRKIVPNQVAQFMIQADIDSWEYEAAKKLHKANGTPAFRAVLELDFEYADLLSRSVSEEARHRCRIRLDISKTTHATRTINRSEIIDYIEAEKK